MEGEGSKIGAAIDDGLNAGRYHSIDRADTVGRSMEHVIDTDMLHEMKMHQEMANVVFDVDGGEDSVVEVVHVVKDRHRFGVHLS